MIDRFIILKKLKDKYALTSPICYILYTHSRDEQICRLYNCMMTVKYMKITSDYY